MYHAQFYYGHIHNTAFSLGGAGPWLVLEYLPNGDLKTFLEVRTLPSISNQIYEILK